MALALARTLLAGPLDARACAVEGRVEEHAGTGRLLLLLLSRELRRQRDWWRRRWRDACQVRRPGEGELWGLSEGKVEARLLGLRLGLMRLRLVLGLLLRLRLVVVLVLALRSRWQRKTSTTTAAAASSLSSPVSTTPIASTPATVVMGTPVA